MYAIYAKPMHAGMYTLRPLLQGLFFEPLFDLKKSEYEKRRSTKHIE